MLIGATINGEYIDICLPQERVEIFLAKLLSKKWKISFTQARQKLKSQDMRALQKEYEAEIRKHFGYLIDQEITKWRNYDSYIKSHKK